VKRKKILFVAMQMSSHTARWIEQICDQEWEVHLFPVNYLPPHPSLRNVTVHQPWWVVSPRAYLGRIKRRILSLVRGKKTTVQPNGVVIRPIYPIPVLYRMTPYLNGLRRVPLGESGATAPAFYGPKVLSRLISKLKPDLIHSLEFQHCGYNVLAAKALSGNNFPKWLATNWGSDIYHYRQFPAHRAQISRLLQNVDYYSCECTRDVGLARELGLTGDVMPVIPNTGGLDIPLVMRLREVHTPSLRPFIMVKGYQHFAGRALIALDAIERCFVDMRRFKIIVYSASPEVIPRVEELRQLGLDVLVLGNVSHDTILRMFSRARIYLGVSAADAISTSLLEAMAMGAFPIQTNTSCCNEWIRDGESGFEIPVDDVEVIASRLRQAANDDALVDRASVLNLVTIKERVDQSKLKVEAIGFYERIFTEEVSR
jgi:glycosyltransferase involved in cell wall biosynthesis